MDFSYEVSRSISACQGVLLIIDANQVQIQFLFFVFFNSVVPEFLLFVCAHAAAEVWVIFYVCVCFFKGIQAQTVANFYLAFEAQLAIIPVINKVNNDLLMVSSNGFNIFFSFYSYSKMACPID